MQKEWYMFEKRGDDLIWVSIMSSKEMKGGIRIELNSQIIWVCYEMYVKVSTKEWNNGPFLFEAFKKG